MKMYVLIYLENSDNGCNYVRIGIDVLNKPTFDLHGHPYIKLIFLNAPGVAIQPVHNHSLRITHTAVVIVGLLIDIESRRG